MEKLKNFNATSVDVIGVKISEVEMKYARAYREYKNIDKPFSL